MYPVMINPASGSPRWNTVTTIGNVSRQGNPEEQPRRQELAQHRLRDRHGQGKQQFDRADLALLSPEPHGGRRDHKREQHRQVDEEEPQVRLPYLRRTRF